MIYATADLHFNHARIIELCGRPFSDVSEMNQVMIERWNSVVEYHDEVHVLGDFAFWYKGAEALDDIFYQLNGEKHLTVGNHDEQNSKVLRLPWKSVDKLRTVRFGAQRFVLCHFPLHSWWHMERGVLHLHGHCHGSLKPQMAHRFDVGVDGYDFYPQSLEDITRWALEQPFEGTDHHI